MGEKLTDKYFYDMLGYVITNFVYEGLELDRHRPQYTFFACNIEQNSSLYHKIITLKFVNISFSILVSRAPDN
jgi:hypothetical protein